MRERVEGEITRLMHAQDPAALAANFAAVALVAWLHRDTPNQAALVTWTVAWLLCNSIYLASYFHQRRMTIRAIQRARSRWSHLIITNFISVLPAGFMPWLFSPTAEALYLNTALVVIYCSGVFASNTMLSSAAFVIGGATIFSPLIALLFLQRTIDGTGIAIALMLYYVFMIPFSIAQSRAIRRAIQVGFDNEALARKLAFETERADVARIVAENARAEAEEAVRAKARFLAAATHDLRQPLHALSLTFASLRGGETTLGSEGQIERANECARNLSTMFDSLLDQARLDAGTLDLKVEPLSLATVFAQIEAQFQPQAKARGLWLRSRPTDAVLLSDPTAMWRVLSNLITNAIEATDTGGIHIAWRATSNSLEVRDSGRGIAVADQTVIFEEFRRLPQRGDAADRGLGLGLSTVRRLARLLDAEVTVRSTPGRGSVFRVRFAANRVCPEGTVVTRVVHSNAAELETSGAVTNNIRVLAVDDDPAIRDALADLLTQWGYDARLAASAAEAEQQVVAWQPQVLLLDRHLPDGNGLVLGEKLRLNIKPAPACLIITGDTAPEDLRAMRTSGFTVLHKPVTPENLREVLARVTV
jgi:two-component system, sensor histidine kinase